MPQLNFSVVNDPRTAYNPRVVDGLMAYWNANKGQMQDYQTGGALQPRIDAIRSQQPVNPGAYIYGDSYGQIQGVEESRRRAAEQMAMQLAQLNAAARERALARQDSNDRYDLLNQFRNSQLAQKNQSDQEKLGLLAQNLGLKQLAEQGKNDRSAAAISAKMRMASAKNAAAQADQLDQLDSEGSTLADEWSKALNRYNDLRGQVGDFEQGYAASASEIAPFVASNRVSGTGFGYTAAPGDAEAAAIAEKANAFARAKQSAKASSQEMAALVKDMDSMQRSMQQYGYSMNPRTGAISHPDLPGSRWDLSVLPMVQPAAAPMTEDQYLARFASPVSTGPKTGVAKAGGRWVK
jgi:hypothetical protein